MVRWKALKNWKDFMDINLNARNYGKQSEADRLMGKAIREACKPGMKPYTVVVSTPGGMYRATFKPWKPKINVGYKIEVKGF